MLEEFQNVRQREDEGRRRLFVDGYFQLMVWFDGETEAMTGFQLSYDIRGHERVVTYKTDEGRLVRSHHYNTGQVYEYHGSAWSSILAGDPGHLDPMVFDRFLIAARHLEPGILAYVKEHLGEFC